MSAGDSPRGEDDHEAREREVFWEACDLAEPERTAFLDRACAGDEALRRRVDALLAQDSAADQLVDGPVLAHLPGLTGATALPETIGPYRIQSVLGAGGMGVVYEARQEHPRRAVALKVIRPGLMNESLLRRFEHEARVLGWLNHPGIAQIYEAGTADTGHGPQPFFAMELVRGAPLLRWASERGLEVPARLELLARVCDAVHHAHQKGVIHRDLKPANVLVDEHGQPKVLDFGVARATDADLAASTVHTAVGELVGTLSYMSPEQVGGQASALDTRSDVYALGVIAYELLSGRLPLDLAGQAVHEAARVIVEGEPAALGAVVPALRGDVETIVARALEKDRERRYASAEELAADLRRFLANEPIVARAPTALYQWQKFARRNRALVGGVAGVFLALLAGLVASWTLYRRSEDRGTRLAAALDATTVARRDADMALAQEREARRQADSERRRAEDARRELAESQDWFDGFFEAASPTAEGNDVRVVDVLERAAASVDAAFPDRPLARARLLHRIGATYREIGLAGTGLPFLEQALALEQANGAPDPDEGYELSVDLARAYQGDQRYEEALAWHRESLARLAALGAEPSRREVSSRNGVLQCLTMLSRLAEAGTEAVAARTAAQALLDAATDTEGVREARVSLAKITETQAAIAKQAGRRDDALRFIDECLALHETLGSNAWDHGNALLLAGQIHGDLGELDVAETLVRRSLEEIRDAVGPEHPAVLARLTALGSLAFRRGDHAAARAAFEEALELNERLYPGRNQMHGVLLGHLGLTLCLLGQRAEAEDLQRDAVAELRETQPGGLDLSSNLSNLATNLMRLGRSDEALPLMEEAVAITEQAAGPTHYRLGRDLATLAQIKEALGDTVGGAADRQRSQEIAAANQRP